MTTNQIIISILCAALVLLSLGLSMVIPHRDPGFPGKNLLPFAVVVVLAIGGMLTAVEVLGFDEEGEAAEIVEVAPGETPAEPPAEGGPPAEPASGDPVAGKEVFTSTCAVCHTLADAGATGGVGPNLDDAKPSAGLVVDIVTNGRGNMPALGGSLSEEQIENVAAYVVQATAG